MAKVQELAINPAVLVWARKTAGLSVQQVAETLGRSANFILDIESPNKGRVSKTILHDLAQLYDRSFVTLLLPEPPAEDSIPTDYRTLPQPKQTFGPETARALREARRLQHGLSDLLADNSNLLPHFKPIQVAVTEKPNQVALQVRQFVGVDMREQVTWPDSSHAFRRWRGRLQKLGILVLVEEFPRGEARGFSLWSPDLIPTIVISHEEAPAAQTFTLFHELAHVLARTDAMCLKQENQTVHGKIETWCNRVAAGTLLPEQEVRNLVAKTKDVNWEDPNDLYQISSRFRVSRHVAAIRLEELGLVPAGYYSKIKQLLDPDDSKQAPKRRDPNKPYKTDPAKERLAEVGFTTANAVLQSCRNAALSTIEAADLLRIQPAKFGRLLGLASDQGQRYG